MLSVPPLDATQKPSIGSLLRGRISASRFTASAPASSQADDLTKGFLGAPLDFLKVVAAISMCLESANFVLWDNQIRFFWYLDRWTFPLFSFALAVHIVRGFDFRRQVVSLLVLGALTQPIYAAVFPDFAHLNIFITLAIGAALAGTMSPRSPRLTDAVLACALAAIVVVPQWLFRWEYALLGAVLPLAMASALRGPWMRALWPVALIGTTYISFEYGKPGWASVLSIELAFALVGTICVVAAAYLLKGLPRFLWRYALHIVYPGHLAALLLITYLWPAA